MPAGSTIYLYTATDQNSMTTTPDVVGKTGTFAELVQHGGYFSAMYKLAH